MQTTQASPINNGTVSQEHGMTDWHMASHAAIGAHNAQTLAAYASRYAATLAARASVAVRLAANESRAYYAEARQQLKTAPQPVPVVQPAAQPQTNNLWPVAMVAIAAIIAIVAIMAVDAMVSASTTVNRPVPAPPVAASPLADLDEVSRMIAPVNRSELSIVERVRVDGSRERYVMYVPDPATRALNLSTTDPVVFKVAQGWVITALTNTGLRTYRAGEEGRVQMVYDAIRAYRVAD